MICNSDEFYMAVSYDNEVKNLTIFVNMFKTYNKTQGTY